MKQTAILFALVMGTTLAFGQNDLSITLNSPTNNSTQGPAIPLTFDVTITNSGTVDVSASDTILYAPTLDGGLLSSGGQALVYAIIGPLTAGQSVNRTHNFTGFNLGTAPAQQFEFCGLAIAVGPNWRGIVESDTVNNFSCVTINYDPNGVVSIDENTLVGQLKPRNESYFANGTLYIRVVNVDNAAKVSMRIIDLNGRVVREESLEASNFSIENDMPLNLSQGIYLMQLEGRNGVIGTTKLMVR